MSSKLLTNGYVITVDEARNVYPRGFVHVVGERIEARSEERRVGKECRL